MIMTSQNPKIPFEVPNEVRDFADKSLEQARRAMDTFMESAHKASSSLEQSTHQMQASAREMTEKSVGLVEQNVQATLGMMQQLVHARGMEEILKIQADFMQQQIKAVQEQARALGSAMQSSVTPKP
jgi:phasin